MTIVKTVKPVLSSHITGKLFKTLTHSLILITFQASVKVAYWNHCDI